MAGSEKNFGLTLPADFSDVSLANQSIVFAVKVHSVKVRQLPDIDDELAKAVGGGETLEELREAVRQRLQGRLERDARVMFENALVETVVNRSTIEVPDIMIDRQVDSQIDDLKTDLGRERLTWQEYLDRAKTSEEKMRADLRPSAISSLKSYLAIREVARKEGIQVDPSEVTAEIEETAAQFGRARNAVKERLSTREQRDKIEGRMFLAKATARLAEIAQQPVIASATVAEDASTLPSTEIAHESAVPAEPVGSDSSAAPDASAGDDATRESESLPPV
jgi:trigger factor